jgi:hypothetical protein
MKASGKIHPIFVIFVAFLENLDFINSQASNISSS